jgi:uncharacterized membrane protein YcaP (DUF421 family)
MSDLSPFDFVLLLILCSALVAIDIGLSLLERASPRVERLLDGSAALLVRHGRPVQATMRAMRIDAADILAAARCAQGLERMEQIRLAVVETNGEISVVPEPDARIRPGPAA